MLNLAILMGRLVADPELRRTNSDLPVTTFRLAVDRGYAKPGEEKQTDFIDIVCWRGQAEFAAKYFHKGQLVAVEGSIRVRSYEAKDGSRRTATEVVANQVHFAESKRDSGAAPSHGEGHTERPAAAQPAVDNGDFIEIEGDDELPF